MTAKIVIEINCEKEACKLHGTEYCLFFELRPLQNTHERVPFCTLFYQQLEEYGVYGNDGKRCPQCLNAETHGFEEWDHVCIGEPPF